MHPLRKWALGSAVVVALLVAVPLAGLPLGGVAVAADVGDDSSASSSTPKNDYAAQSEDADRPRDRSLLDKNAADAAVAKKKQQQAAEPAFYEKWQFWAIVGGVAVGAVVAVIAAQKISHQVNGGDVRPCATTDVACFGAGH